MTATTAHSHGPTQRRTLIRQPAGLRPLLARCARASLLLLVNCQAGCSLYTKYLHPGAGAGAESRLSELMSRTPSATMESKYSFARLMERRGQHEQARKLYGKILEGQPEHAEVHHRLAVMAARDARFAEAHERFEQALEAGGRKAQLLSDIGYAYYLEHRLAEAEKILREAIQLEPELKSARTNLGLVLGMQQRFAESLDAFKHAGSEADAYSNLAYVHAQLGNYQRAQALYSRALTLDETIRPAALAMVQLAKLQRGSAASRPDAQHIASQTASNVAAPIAVDEAPFGERTRTYPGKQVAYLDDFAAGTRSRSGDVQQAIAVGPAYGSAERSQEVRQQAEISTPGESSAVRQTGSATIRFRVEGENRKTATTAPAPNEPSPSSELSRLPEID